MAIRVLVGEDDFLVREGLREVLGGDPGLRVVAAGGDLPALEAALERDPPDVILTDIRMPPTRTDEGIRLARTVRAAYPGVGVVILSQSAEPEYALALLDAGSDRRAYLLKERLHDRASLSAAIRAVAAGGSMIDPKVVETLVAARNRAERSPLRALTAREREVLAEIAQGKSNAAIAESLVLTKRAVEKHINAIFLKLGLAFADDVAKRVKATLIFLADTEDGDGRPVA